MLAYLQTKKRKFMAFISKVLKLWTHSIFQYQGNTGHTQNNGAVLIVNTIKTAPFFCVCPVHLHAKYKHHAINNSGAEEATAPASLNLGNKLRCEGLFRSGCLSSAPHRGVPDSIPDLSL